MKTSESASFGVAKFDTPSDRRGAAFTCSNADILSLISITHFDGRWHSSQEEAFLNYRITAWQSRKLIETYPTTGDLFLALSPDMPFSAIKLNDGNKVRVDFCDL
jgi:hypothetical protein